MHADALVTRLRAAGCVFAEDEARIIIDAATVDGSTDAAIVERMALRREAGDPLEQIVGHAAFDGLRVLVAPGVFVPRQRTIALVDAAAAAIDGSDGALVLDLCCGTGAIGLALARRRPDIRLHASDLDAVAVACARENLAGIGTVHAGDLFAALPAALRRRFDVIAANVPYVPSEAIAMLPPEARIHEPRSTLDGGDDGLDVARRIAAEAAAWLAPGGSVVIEADESQTPALAAAFEAGGLSSRVHRDEERETSVVIGRAPVGIVAGL